MKKLKIGDLCEILNGYAFKSDKYVKDGIRVIRITNVQKGFVEDEKPQFYPIAEINNVKDYMLEEDDLLVSLTGNVGRVAMLDRRYLPAALNQRVACLRVKNIAVLKKYLYYALLTKKFEDDCIVAAKGIAQKNMSTEWLKKYEINIPLLTEQEDIIKVMDRLSAIICDRNKEIEALDKLIKSQFIEMFGDPVINSKGWNKSTIGSVIKSITAGWSVNGEAREKHEDEKAVLKVSAVTQGFFKEDEYKVIDKEQEIKKYVFPQKGDLLFSRANTREMVGATCIIEKDYPNLLLPDKLWKVLFRDNVNVYYMKYIMSHPAVRADFSAQSTGTSGSMYNVSMDKFKAVIIPIPPLELQNEFAQFVRQVDKLKFEVQKALDDTQMMFDSLMNEYFE